MRAGQNQIKNSEEKQTSVEMSDINNMIFQINILILALTLHN